jgi:pilus assembly protein CpaC
MNSPHKRKTGSTMTKTVNILKQAFSLIALAFLLAGQGAITPAAALGQEQGGQFVRIGLNKSIVVRLPANAQDVLIGNPEIVEAVVRTQRTAYLFAKKAGQTNAFFFDKNGRQILNLDIEVAQDMKALRKLLQRVLPGNQITVETVGENIVLGGVAKNPSQAKLAFDLAAKYTNDEAKVLTTISVAGKEQVTLKVKVAEMQREVLKQFGVNASAVEKLGNATIQLFSQNPFTVAGAALSGTNFGIGGKGSTVPFNSTTDTAGVLRALERDGFIRTLAEPNLTAISGEAAKFLAGGEFPIVTSSNDGDVSIEYKPFGVGLGFTPVVLSHGRISLKLNAEVSDISSDNSLTINGLSIPAFEVRRAETTVELPSGGSMAMAGLIRESTKQAINGIPGAKNLPVLGALFRSRDYASKRSELVIIVTPYIVQAVNEKQLVTPVDRAVVASDTQTILFGRLNKVFGKRTTGKGVYHGNVGFIVE